MGSMHALRSKPSQEGDTLRVEIGPAEGSYPGMAEDAELRTAPARRLAAGIGDGQRLSDPAGWSRRRRRLEIRRQHADHGDSCSCGKRWTRK